MIEIHEISRSCILTPLLIMCICNCYDFRLNMMFHSVNNVLYLCFHSLFHCRLCLCRSTLSNCVKLFVPFQVYCQILDHWNQLILLLRVDVQFHWLNLNHPLQLQWIDVLPCHSYHMNRRLANHQHKCSLFGCHAIVHDDHIEYEW